MKLVQYGLCALLLIAPLLFGSVEMWSLALMEIMCLGLFLFWFFKKPKTEKPLSIIKPPFLTPVFLLLGIAVLQIIPLPPVILKIISPNTYNIYQNSLLYEGTLPWLTLSVYPHATVLEIIRFIAYICVYFLAFQILRDKQSILRMATAILIIGAFISLIGIFQLIFWNGKLLWFRELSHGGWLFGPYVNRNHFAGLMEMVIPVCISMLILFFPNAKNNYSLRGMLSDFLTHQKINSFILSFTTVIIMITALFLSLSRGGIIGLSISMVFFGIMLSVRNSTRKNGLILIVIFIVILFTVGWFGWKPIIEKFEKIKGVDISSQYRLKNWEDSMGIISKFPIFGTGPGTYKHIYPGYKTIPAQQKWEHAHNDYIEGAVELGLPGLLIAIYMIAVFYRRMFVILRERKSLHSRLLGLGGMTGVTGILIHSLTDFNLHIGANGLYFSFLIGFAVAASHARMRENGNGTLLEAGEIKIPPNIRKPLIAGVAVICIALSAVAFLSAVAEEYYTAAQGPINQRSEVLSTKRIMLKRGYSLSLLDARFPFAMANIDSALERKNDAIGNYKRAVKLNPVNGEYLQALGIALDRAGEKETAVKYMQLSLKYHPTSAWMHKNYSLWLFSKGKKQEAMTEMKKAITLDPSNTRKYITALVLSRLRPGEIRDVIPENPLSLLLYGRYREEKGDMGEALNAYLNALSSMKKEGIVIAEVYQRITGIYERKNMTEQALLYYEEGVAENPRDHTLRFGLAMLYDRLNFLRKAKEEYERVLILYPGNQHAQQRLKELSRK